ncbi:MAG: hypothetical protein ACK5LE_04830 [Alphaproteobacteria bacterium]
MEVEQSAFLSPPMLIGLIALGVVLVAIAYLAYGQHKKKDDK